MRNISVYYPKMNYPKRYVDKILVNNNYKNLLIWYTAIHDWFIGNGT